MSRPFASLLLSVSILAGCASDVGRRDTLSWLEARGADAMDVVGARVALGTGLGAYVRATQVLQLGFLFRGPLDDELVGTTSVRTVPCFMFGTIGRYGGAWFDEHSELMFPGYTTRTDQGSIEREVIVGSVPLDGTTDAWEWSIGAGIHWVVLGVEAEVRPFEVVDLLAGIVGYDPSSDDVPELGPDADS